MKTLCRMVAFLHWQVRKAHCDWVYTVLANTVKALACDTENLISPVLKAYQSP